MTLAGAGAPQSRQEAVRSLAFVTVKAAAAPLRKIALDPAEPAGLRMDAISALAKRETAELLPLLPLLNDADPDIATETVRALRTHVAEAAVKTALEAKATDAGLAEGLKAHLALALGTPPPAGRPATDAEWNAALQDRSAPASAARGRLVFFSASALCSTCHIAEGRGVMVGPSLGNIARSSDRPKLIQSIMEPSREIGPLYGTKAVTMKDGSVISGVQAIRDGGGNLNIIQAGGVVVPAPRHLIVKVDETGISLMPEGMELGLTLQDFRDLLAYLETLK
jgi:putative heme-binding domain-containing protein